MKKTIIIISIFSVLLSACSKDFLDRQDLNTLNAESFWASGDDAERAVNSVYNAMARPMAYNMGFIVFGDVAADDLMCIDNNWFIDIDQYSVQSTDISINGQDGHTQGIWAVMYNAIMRTGWVLNNIDNVGNISKQIKQRSKLEVRFLRALAYFTLINIFGDVPFYDEVVSAETAKTINVTDKEIIYDFIEEELQAAAGVDMDGNDIPDAGLPVKGTYELGRATKGAALGLLARVYLYRGKYQMAKTIAKKIIDMETYQLNPDFGENWDNHNPNGIESIFAFNFRARGLPQIWAMNPGSWMLSFTLNGMFDPNSGGGWIIIQPEEHVPDLFEYADDGSDIDQRRPMSVYKAGDRYEYAPEEIQWYVPMPPSYCMISKYSRRNHFDEEQTLSNYLDANTPIQVIRYAEIILIYAEACYQTGDVSTAFQYLNMIRERAGLQPFNATEDFMEKLMHERRLEFFAEGHRFYDLRRWGKLEEVLGPLGYDTNTQGLFPYPAHDVSLNENLKQNQNQGY